MSHKFDLVVTRRSAHPADMRSEVVLLWSFWAEVSDITLLLTVELLLHEVQLSPQKSPPARAPARSVGRSTVTWLKMGVDGSVYRSKT